MEIVDHHFVDCIVFRSVGLISEDILEHFGIVGAKCGGGEKNVGAFREVELEWPAKVRGKLGGRSSRGDGRLAYGG